MRKQLLFLYDALRKGMPRFLPAVNIFWVLALAAFLVVLFKLMTHAVVLMDIVALDSGFFWVYLLYFVTFSLPCVFVRSVLLAFFLRPVYRLGILGNPQSVGKGQFLSRKASKRLFFLPLFVLVSSVLFYFLQSLFFVVSQGYYAILDPFLLGLELAQYLFAGYVFGCFEYNLLSFLLREKRLALQVFALDERDHKRLPLRIRSMNVSLGIVLYMALLFFANLFVYVEHMHVYDSVMVDYLQEYLSLDQAKTQYYGYLRTLLPFWPETSPAFPRTGDRDFLQEFMPLILVILGMSLFLCFSVLFFQGKDFSAQIALVRSRVDALTHGKNNLTDLLHIVSSDELGYLVHSVNQFLLKLTQVFREISALSLEVNRSSELLSLSVDEASNFSEQLAGLGKEVMHKSQEQIRVVEENQSILEMVLSLIQEVNDSVHKQVQSVKYVSERVNHMVGDSNQMGQHVQHAYESMEKLVRVARHGGEILNSSLEAIHEISNSSHQVEKSITVISQIAEQTNLLAMNAAIEAGNAGETGKGFVVIADEIQKLAETSSKSSSDIIAHITVMLSHIDTGVKLTEEAESAFQVITQDINHNSTLMTKIQDATRQQVALAHALETFFQEVVAITAQIQGLSKQEYAKSQQIAHTMHKITEAAKNMKDFTKQQDRANLQITDMLNKIIEISRQNKLIVTGLQDLLKGFHLDIPAQKDNK